MEFPLKLNSVQKSLAIPAAGTLVLAASLGTNGAAIGFLLSIPAAPLIFWKTTAAERKAIAKASFAALLAGCSVFTSIVSGFIGDAVIHQNAFKNSNTNSTKKTKPTNSLDNKEVAVGPRSREERPPIGKKEAGANTQPGQERKKAQEPKPSKAKYTREETIQQYVVFLNLLKANNAPSEGMGALETRTRAQNMLKAAGFDPSMMENLDRKRAWDEVFGNR